MQKTLLAIIMVMNAGLYGSQPEPTLFKAQAFYAESTWPQERKDAEVAEIIRDFPDELFTKEHMLAKQGEKLYIVDKLKLGAETNRLSFLLSQGADWGKAWSCACLNNKRVLSQLIVVEKQKMDAKK